MVHQFQTLPILIYPYWNVDNRKTTDEEASLIILIYPYWNVDSSSARILS